MKYHHTHTNNSNHILCLIIAISILFLVFASSVNAANFAGSSEDYSTEIIHRVKATSFRNVLFEVKDSSTGLPLSDALVRVTRTGFSTYGYTDSNGKVTLHVEEGNVIHSYLVFKYSYQTGGGLILPQDNYKNVNLNKLSETSWWPFYVTDGIMSGSFTSPDSDTAYNAGEQLNYVLRFSNIGVEELLLNTDHLETNLVDSSTGAKFRSWGGIQQGEISGHLYIRPNGYVEAQPQAEGVKVCITNGHGDYKGQSFDVGPNEFFCSVTPGYSSIVPEWVIPLTLKFAGTFGYVLNGNYISFTLDTQSFTLDNPVQWHPQVISSPVTTATVGQPYSYTMQTITYPSSHFIHYSLVNSPAGMTINKNTGKIIWTPTVEQGGSQHVTARAYHSYFEAPLDNVIAYTNQDYTINVIPVSNLYPSNIYVSTPTLTVNNYARVRFYLHNTANQVLSSVTYKIHTDSPTNPDITRTIHNVPANGYLAVWDSWKYTSAGQFTPIITIDSDNVIAETDEADNSISFAVTVTSQSPSLSKPLQSLQSLQSIQTIQPIQTMQPTQLLKNIQWRGR